jgi:hypothetical protein
VYSDLRNESVDFANSQPFFGIAIGGSLGDKKGTMHDIVRNTAGIWHAVSCCIIPSRERLDPNTYALESA